ncbi:MAG TPA: hypothetical protein VE266_03255 [Steroidobacteraceae bacterium]|nr:hypothetical protein [Steroidobacteraceae bacterium]
MGTELGRGGAPDGDGRGAVEQPPEVGFTERARQLAHRGGAREGDRADPAARDPRPALLEIQCRGLRAVGLDLRDPRAELSQPGGDRGQRP